MTEPLVKKGQELELTMENATKGIKDLKTILVRFLELYY